MACRTGPLPADAAEFTRDLWRRAIPPTGHRITDEHRAELPRLVGWIRSLRNAGWPLQAVADAVNVSRQRVDQVNTQSGTARYAGLPEAPPIPPKRPATPMPKARRRLRLSEENTQTLQRLYHASVGAAGGLPGAEGRVRMYAFNDELLRLSERGVPHDELAAALGVWRRALTGRLEEARARRVRTPRYGGVPPERLRLLTTEEVAELKRLKARCARGNPRASATAAAAELDALVARLNEAGVAQRVIGLPIGELQTTISMRVTRHYSRQGAKAVQPA